MATDIQQTLSRCLRPPTERVVKLGNRWFVTNVENPSQLLHGPSFRRKRDAVEFASLNAGAVFKRLREEASQ